jgi:hypothetical protein
MAWYIAALPASVPMKASRSRRFRAVFNRCSFACCGGALAHRWRWTKHSHPSGKYNRSFRGCYTIGRCARRPFKPAKSSARFVGSRTMQNSEADKQPAAGKRHRNSVGYAALEARGQYFNANICNNVLIYKGENPLVRSRGLEPPRVAPLAPQASASTNSATTACGVDASQERRATAGM